MTRRTPTSFLTLLFVAIFGGVSMGAPATLPSEEDVQHSFGEEKYSEAIQKISRLLALKGPAARGVDRYALLMLKGESHLRMKVMAPALNAFADAAKEAKDRKQEATARATELLVRRAKALQYTSKSGDKTQTFDVTEIGKRTEAFKALLEDELDAASAKLKAATRADSLPPIMEAAKTLSTLHSLELAAGDEENRTAKVVEGLADHADKLMAKAVKNLGARLLEIERQANELIEYTVDVPDSSNPKKTHSETRVRKRGLDGRMTSDLKDTISTAEKIGPAAKELADALGTDAGDFESIVTQAEDAGKRAAELLDADYGTTDRRRW